jgi:nitrite reductase/ring-hydroxylating ferredoxin subunit
MEMVFALTHPCDLTSTGRVRCPWHGACYNTKTGDIEDFPGKGKLASYPATLEDGKVVIHTTKEALAQQVVSESNVVFTQ